MSRLFLKLVLACFCGLSLQALSLPAQTAPAKAAALPALSDNEVLLNLNSAQRLQWSAAQKQINDGQSLMDSGKWLLQNTQPKDSGGMTDTHAADKIKDGQQQVTDGTALIAKGKQTLATLRLAAQQAVALTQNPNAPGKYTVVLTSAQWPDVVQQMSDKLIKSLASDNYSQIFLADTYTFIKSHYVAKPALTSQIHDALAQSVDEHQTLYPQGTVKLGRLGNNLFLDFPNRASTASNQAALVVGEILFEPDSGYAYFSLRAVDLVSGKIIRNELALLSVEATLGKGLDLVAYQVPSARILPPPTPAVTTPAAPANSGKPASATPAAPASAPAANDASTVTLTLLDSNNVIGTFKSVAHPYIFRADTAGSNDTLGNRVALLLLKTLLTEKSPLTVTDYDFLALALPADNPSDRTLSPADINATWLVSSLRDLDAPTISLGLKARSLASSAELNAGKFTVENSLKPLTPPTPDQLIAAGYQLTSSNTPDSGPADAGGSSAQAIPSALPSPVAPGTTLKHSP